MKKWEPLFWLIMVTGSATIIFALDCVALIALGVAIGYEVQ